MAGAFFAALAAIDVTVATLYIGGLKEMINLVSSFMEVNWSVTFTPAEAAFYFFGLLASWIVFIVNAVPVSYTHLIFCSCNKICSQYKNFYTENVASS